MCMTKKMGNMRDTSLLYDCWIPGIRLVDCIQQNSTSAKVHDIILEGYWFMKDLYLVPVWEQI